MAANAKMPFIKVLPVLSGFYILGFGDMAGFSTNYIQKDFGLSETVAGFLPSLVFFWFLLSVPLNAFRNKIGCKKTVLLSMAIIIGGMLVTFYTYTLVSCIFALLLLGIGNTFLQLSLHPLLSGIAQGEALAASLTSGQVIKAVSSFCGPFIAAFAVSIWGGWQYLFPVYAVITLVSVLWLAFTPLPVPEENVFLSVKDTFALLKDTGILWLFLGCVFVAGADVGMNMVTPKLMMERCGHAMQDAALGSSVYFAFRTLGVFVGTMLLAYMPEKKYFRSHILLALLAILALMFAEGEYFILMLAGVVGYGCSSIFAIIYSLAVRSYSDKASAVSGLMLTGLLGGALIPPLMGIVAHGWGEQKGALVVIVVSISYLVYGAFRWWKK